MEIYCTRRFSFIHSLICCSALWRLNEWCTCAPGLLRLGWRERALGSRFGISGIPAGRDQFLFSEPAPFWSAVTTATRDQRPATRDQKDRTRLRRGCIALRRCLHRDVKRREKICRPNNSCKVYLTLCLSISESFTRTGRVAVLSFDR